jgi:hypothetical protein
VDGLEEPAIPVAQESKVDTKSRIPDKQEHDLIVGIIAFIGKFRFLAHPPLPYDDEVAPVPLGSAGKYPAAIAAIQHRYLVKGLDYSD